MTWFSFAWWLSGLYCLYYLGNIVFDKIQSRSSLADDTPIHELTFSEHELPTEVTFLHEQTKNVVQPVPAATALGGVTLSGLWELARAERIHLSPAVSF